MAPPLRFNKLAPARCTLRSLTTTVSPLRTRKSANGCWKSSKPLDFTVYKPRGAYYIMTDISRFDFPANDPRFASGSKDVAFAKYLVQEIGVACVPGSSFYNDPQDGASQVRFTFCKKEETLAAAEERFAKLRV